MADTLIPLTDLPERYNISRTVVYERMEGLGIKPIKMSRRSFLTEADIKKLDELHQHIGKGGTITEFVGFRNLSTQLSTDNGDMTPTDGYQLANIESEALVFKMIEALTSVNQQPPADPTWYHERLEKCVEKNWILSTSEVEGLIGTKPKGETYQRGCWEFIRTGKVGSQSGWKVRKLE